MSDPAEPMAEPDAPPPPPAPSAPDEESGLKPAAGPPMLVEVQEEYVPCLFRYVTAIARISGVITIIVLWVITGNMLGANNSSMGAREWYMLALSVVFTIFESLWMINKCASKMKNEGCICACWHVCIWFDNWKKTILYIGISIPCLVDPIANVQTIIAAILILVTSVFYFLRSFKDSGCVKRKSKKSMNYVETGNAKANLVSHEVQTEPDYEATSNGVDSKSSAQN